MVLVYHTCDTMCVEIFYDPHVRHGSVTSYYDTCGTVVCYVITRVVRHVLYCRAYNTVCVVRYYHTGDTAVCYSITRVNIITRVIK